MSMTTHPSGWTTNKPKEAGWYWWRRPEFDPTIAEVYDLHGEWWMWLCDEGSREDAVPVSTTYDDAEWLGPITPEQYVEWANREGR